VPGAEGYGQTSHRWRAEFGRMEGENGKRLEELERENSQLKRLVADEKPELRPAG
jgi:hypothetical protein